jgi:hypothetical protein
MTTSELAVYSTDEWFQSLVWQHRWIEYFVGWWVGHFGKPTTVTDFGAGDGWWPHTFVQMGTRWAWAVELYEKAREYIPKDVNAVLHDLREPMVVETRSDVVICLEVGEHLPPSAACTLVETIVSATKGVLLFSAAGPGQPGTGHINLQPPEYWRDMISAYRGIDYSPWRTDETRRAFENIDNGTFDFLYRNLQVFARIQP